MASFSMPVHAPCWTVQPCHSSAKRGQLIFLSPSAMTRCDPHIPASLWPCSHRRQKCPTVAVVLLPFCWTDFMSGISDQRDDACLDTFTQEKKDTLRQAVCVFSYRIPRSWRQNNIFASLFPATNSSRPTIDSHPNVHVCSNSDWGLYLAGPGKHKQCTHLLTWHAAHR